MVGVVGGAVMSVGLAIGRAMGMPAELEMMGTMMMPAGPATFILGSVVHLVASGLIALVYIAEFEYVTHRGLARWRRLRRHPHLIADAFMACCR